MIGGIDAIVGGGDGQREGHGEGGEGLNMLPALLVGGRLVDGTREGGAAVLLLLLL